MSEAEPSANAAAPVGVNRDDWDTHWENFANATERNPAQAFRRRIVTRVLAGKGGPQRYLDIGSGQGDLAVAVAGRWPRAEVVGLELSERGVEIASRKVPRGRFVQFDLLSGQEPPDGLVAWATHASCSEVLEHVDEPQAFLTAARRWLAPGALLVVTVPGGPMSAFDRHIGHRRHYTTVDLVDLLGRSGFEVTSSGGAGFPFFNLYRRTVIARGDQLIKDVDAGGVPLVARVAMAAFDGLLSASPTGGRRGWQIFAAATVPAGRHDGTASDATRDGG